MDVVLIWAVFIGICLVLWSLVLFTVLLLRLAKIIENDEKQEILDDQKNNMNKGW